jgi:diadenosine tetraphosphate (Ap4A) HIT family hydrolase
MRDPNNPCLFCNTDKKEYIFENDLAYATFDSYPVSKFHVLIIPKRHIKNYFDLSTDEFVACNTIIMLCKNKLEQDDQYIEGFNIGSNTGKVAGQSINHCHIHLIPRRKGDVENPQGGVRGVIPSKQHYIRKTK